MCVNVICVLKVKRETMLVSGFARENCAGQPGGSGAFVYCHRSCAFKLSGSMTDHSRFYLIACSSWAPSLPSLPLNLVLQFSTGSSLSVWQCLLVATQNCHVYLSSYQQCPPTWHLPQHFSLGDEFNVVELNFCQNQNNTGWWSPLGLP